MDINKLLPRKVTDLATGQDISEEKRKQMIIHYLLNGWSFDNIGKVFDVSGNRIYNYCRKNKMLPGRRLSKQLTQQDIEAERERWQIKVDRSERTV